jgi:hypothetical protein
MKVEATNNR